MARITMEEQQEFIVFPVDTLLLLKIEEAGPRDVPGRDGREGWTKLEIKFKILEVLAAGDGGPTNRFDEMVGKEIWGSCSWRLTDSPENKLRIWSEAILQVELGVGFDLDSDMFLGRQVKGVTSQYDGKAVNPTTGQKYKRHQIDTLIPAVGSGGLANPAQQAALNGQGYAPPAQQGWGQPPAQQQGFAQQQHQAYQQPQAPAAQPQQGQWAQQQNLMQQGQQPVAPQAAPQQYQQQPPPQNPQAPAQQAPAAQPPQGQNAADPWQNQTPPGSPDPWALPAGTDEPPF